MGVSVPAHLPVYQRRKRQRKHKRGERPPEEEQRLRRRVKTALVVVYVALAGGEQEDEPGDHQRDSQRPRRYRTLEHEQPAQPAYGKRELQRARRGDEGGDEVVGGECEHDQRGAVADGYSIGISVHQLRYFGLPPRMASRYTSLIFLVSGPTSPLPIGRLSSEPTGVMCAAVPVRKTSSAK